LPHLRSRLKASWHSYIPSLPKSSQNNIFMRKIEPMIPPKKLFLRSSIHQTKQIL
jgi:hypothetical protein